jgi:hypothetical protein
LFQKGILEFYFEGKRKKLEEKKKRRKEYTIRRARAE